MSRRKIRKGSPQRNVPNEGGVVFSAIFEQYVVISRKWCILDTKLLWEIIGNHIQAIEWCHLTTLSDPWPGFQGHGSFKRRVSPKWRFLQTQLLYRTLTGNHRQATDRQASYTALQPHCSYINRANVSQASRGLVSDNWPFLFKQPKPLGFSASLGFRIFFISTNSREACLADLTYQLSFYLDSPVL